MAQHPRLEDFFGPSGGIVCRYQRSLQSPVFLASVIDLRIGRHAEFIEKAIMLREVAGLKRPAAN